ncbi:MAG: 23S rRNA pseudouridine(1911/1915/1917) synthase RluD [Luteibacter sp.]|uniref:23S rRNA pseudouridine(1911/1915/1917) synthase RluD n=1 Tax=Luteibacter TaxID=242605 RepID=UPI0005659795|nr:MULTISPECIES: 23S rRNA pseudouridine(1911/1915/1917) synthase RluD [unclassified Luteibacter]MDQ7997569.1 23S rRNA pseudouridine(1911/1915/1917) synthase RluD [Luteibacter sp.]MDQ8051175.1 23S rRNA pseudouridine(1911/1915/1917) synthase RluD [Luteibacter sp.]MDR6642971.1 23S rRNA pseudouridine1911/1915/1917 synthase [Luteibacter sp. 1214]SKB95237.1 ribosomal large subunit pseudouridine synthase D [Luteibacter sp. 22Crub2.1]
MTTVRHEATVPVTAAGRRFDQSVAEMFPDYSRSRLTGWIKDGKLLLDGARVAPRHLVRGGEHVVLEAELEAEVHALPEDIALDIRYEDDDLLVLDKPMGLVVHPGAGNPAGTLLNALLHHAPSLAELPRGGIVHRLDKDTAGLMVVAKSLAAHTGLVAMLSRHDVHRQYEAVVLGTMVAGGTVDQPIGRHQHDRLKQGVRDVVDGGKEAITHYRVRERFRSHSVLQCNLETGRTHQIRVHMAHIGHPLVGDQLYGNGLRLPRGASQELIDALRGFRRQALHAEKLAFDHPISGERLEFDSPRPADQDALIATLRLDTELHPIED